MKNFKRLNLERLEDRCVPASMRWCDFTGDGKWETASNWAGGDGVNYPGSSDDVSFASTSGVANSIDPCTCAAVDGTTISKSITLDSTYNATTSRLHFSASSGATLKVGSGGIQMAGGGIEQDNGCNIETDGGGSVTGGDLDTETTPAGTLSVATATSPFDITKTGDYPQGEDIVVRDGGTFSMSISAGGKLSFTKGALYVKGGGTFKWNLGNLHTAGPTNPLMQFLNDGKVEYTARTNSTTETCDMLYTQGQEASKPAPAFNMRVNINDTAPSTTWIKWTYQPNGSNLYSFEADAGVVWMPSLGGTNSDKLKMSFPNGPAYFHGADLDSTGGTMASEVADGNITIDAGRLILDANAGFSQTGAKDLTIKGTAELDVWCHGQTSGSCGTWTAGLGCKIHLDGGSATCRAQNADSGWSTGTWTFFTGPSGFMDMTADFGTWIDPGSNGTHGQWFFSSP